MFVKLYLDSENKDIVIEAILRYRNELKAKLVNAKDDSSELTIQRIDMIYNYLKDKE